MVEWETRGSQKAVPIGREGSSPSLAIVFEMCEGEDDEDYDYD